MKGCADVSSLHRPTRCSPRALPKPRQLPVTLIFAARIPFQDRPGRYPDRV
jgi:hypothetical protein